jgi:hypothetical protein
MVFDQQTVNQRVEEFENEHGGRALAILHASVFYWPDGAYRSIDKLGILCDNRPNDINAGVDQVKKNQRYRLFYAQVRLEQTTKIFDDKKAELVRQVDAADEHGGIPPDETLLGDLKNMQAEIQKCAAKLEKIELEINPPRKPLSPEMVRAEEKNRNDLRKYRKQLEQIEI